MNTLKLTTLSESFDKKDFIKNIDLSQGIEFEFISDFFSSRILREFISVICEEYRVDKKLTSQLILIADEMNNNAIEHGSKSWEYNYMRVYMIPKKDHINCIIEVEDTWNGDTHQSALDMETLRAHQLKKGYKQHHSIRWRWLFMLIVQLVDRLYFKDSSNGWLIVGIKKKIKT